MSAFNLKGKVALVTGANRGIGEAFVVRLAEAGVRKIYAAARDETNLEDLQKYYPEQVEPVLLDVTNSEHIAVLPGQISELDILVNNAGIVNACSLSSDETMQISRLEMETNYFGPLHTTLTLLPLLKQSKQAAIINISSIAGISSYPSIASYSATKAALHSYTQGLRMELAENGIQVIGVYPGPIDTRMTAGWEVDKASPEQVAAKTLEALETGETYVLPDDFSTQMYALFEESPRQLEKTFAG